MNFFELQDHARRQTRLMVGLFMLAVAAIVLVLNGVGVLVWAMTEATPFLDTSTLLQQAPRQLYIGVTGVTLATIAFGTISCMIKLSGGGAAVAEMVGARMVQRDTTAPLERRLLNVVEEMAIASGITVPQVYVMEDEGGINAFAAGYSPNEAVVAVTRGTLERLNRDELQGVVGHEFSHILNGDMRLNVRLMGVIAGITIIGGLGRFLMNANSRRSSSDRDGDGKIFLIGLALWIIGSVGVFAGRLIKASISRQREFLADASSVQFTRNPDGIAGALYKIGQHSAVIEERHAEELSHMYFGESVKSMFGLLDTHPPIDDRIERLMGQGAQHLIADRIKRQPPPSTGAEFASGVALADDMTGSGAALAGMAALSAGAWGRSAGNVTLKTSSERILNSVGKPTPSHVEAARSILERIPANLRLATASAEGARAVLFALLTGDGQVRESQLTAMSRVHGNAIAELARQFIDPIRDLGPIARMPLIELLMPTLTGLPQSDRDASLATVGELIEADRKVTIGEFVLQTVCRRYLGHQIKGPPPVKHSGIETVSGEVQTVFSVLTHAGRGGMSAFERGMQALGIPGGVLRTPGELSIAKVEAALYELKLLAPLKKPAFIKACLAIVMADEKLTVLEGELVRALCAALDSPVPPLLDSIEPVN